MSIFLLDDYHDTTKSLYNIQLTKVTNGVFGHPAEFVTPPMTKVAFLLKVNAYRDANNQYEAGGKDFKAEYELKKGEMTDELDVVKAYVEALPAFSVIIGNLSGFNVNKQGISSGLVPGQPILRALTRNGGGTVTFYYNAIDGADYYGTYLVEGDSMPAGCVFTSGVLYIPKGLTAGIIHNGTKQRTKIYHNLVIGQQYTIFAYAGNAVGVSILSEGVTFTASNK